MRFNEKSLAALKPGAKDLLYWDDSFKGNRNGRFGIRVYPLGTKRYIYDYVTKSGERHRIKIGDYNTVSLADARAKAKSHAYEVATGKDPATEARDIKESITLNELIDDFFRLHCRVKLRPKTTKNYKQILEKDLRSTLGCRPIRTIKRRDLQRIINEIVNRGSPMQAERSREALSSLFRFAVSQGLLDENPCLGMAVVAETKPRTRKLSHSEIGTFLLACKGLESKRMGIYFKLLLLTAQRRSEVASAKWRDFEKTESGEIWNFSQTKSGRPQAIPVSRVVADLLVELRGINQALKERSRQDDKSRFDEFLFPSTYANAHGHMTEIKNAFNKVRQAMGGEPFTPHDLRRTASYLLRQLGVRKETLKKILNHASSDVTGLHYDHYEEMPEMEKALNLLGDRVLELACTPNIIDAIAPLSQPAGTNPILNLREHPSD
jgi:integrase